MKISNKITCPAVMAISLPLLVLGGCANNDTVKMMPDETLALEQVIEVDEIAVENNSDIDGFVSIETEESISVIEPVESLIESPVNENEMLGTATPKPDESMIGFAFDQSDIDAQYGELLWQHAQYLKENKNLILNVSGHTDSSGARIYNEFLSKKRADQVAKILLDFGVPKERIKVTGNASDQPLIGAVTNKEHRRVELDYQDQQIVSN
ncbi:MAG: OmpA family protein [Gammaproteobacteria bacterium]|nr:OmpA family protein [Gammaproteobacteria bacterium]